MIGIELKKLKYMNCRKYSAFAWILLCVFIAQRAHAQVGSSISLQQLLEGIRSNYELMKAQGSLVQARQAQKRAIDFQRLPRLNTLFEANVASNNNLEGTYITYGVIPSVTGGNRLQSNLNPVGDEAALVGLNWEA